MSGEKVEEEGNEEGDEKGGLMGGALVEEGHYRQE